MDSNRCVIGFRGGEYYTDLTLDYLKLLHGGNRDDAETRPRHETRGSHRCMKKQLNYSSLTSQ